MNTPEVSVTATPCPVWDTVNVNIIGNVQGIDWVSVISTILSLIALGVSVYTIYQTKKTHKATLGSAFFASIFQDYLLTHFPNSRERICFENGRIKGHDTFVDNLNAMRKDILYFKYADNAFYTSLRQKIQALEDYVVNAMNKEYDSTGQIEFNNTLDKQLSIIFHSINERHCGM